MQSKVGCQLCFSEARWNVRWTIRNTDYVQLLVASTKGKYVAFYTEDGKEDSISARMESESELDTNVRHYPILACFSK